MKTSKLLFALLALCTFTIAQPPVTRGAAQNIMIRAGHLLDVKSGKTLDYVTVMIEGDRIIGVVAGMRPLGGISPPDEKTGVKIIDLPDATLLPGLIDAHTH